MSIYKQNIDPIALTEADADAFLESVGVELFEDSIAIDGTLYEGTYGEEILAENGIFLYEDGIVLEGELADAVKQYRRTSKELAKDTKSDPGYIKTVKDARRDAGKAAIDYIKDRRIYGKDEAKRRYVDKGLEYAGRIASHPHHQKMMDKYNDRMLTDISAVGKAIDNKVDKARKFADKSKERLKATGNVIKKAASRTTKHESTIFSDIEII